MFGLGNKTTPAKTPAGSSSKSRQSAKAAGKSTRATQAASSTEGSKDVVQPARESMDFGRPATVADRKRMAWRPPSITDLLPWNYYNARAGIFEMRDGSSFGVAFELGPTPTEAMPAAMLADRHDKILSALKGIPELDQGEWIVQVYVNEDDDLQRMIDDYEAYILEVHKDEPERGQAILRSDFTQTWIEEVRRHVQRVTRPQGLFEDTKVSGNIWRAQMRRTRLVLFRNAAGEDEPEEEGAPSRIELLNHVAEQLMAGLREADIGSRRITGRDFYHWLMPFFNWRADKRTSELLAMAPYPGDSGRSEVAGQAPIFGWDMAEHLMLQPPKSDPNLGAWQFGERWIKAMTLQQISRPVQIGHFTAECRHADKEFARFDRLPVGSMLSITMVIKPQDLVREHVTKIQGASRAKTPEAQQAFRECADVLAHMATGDKLVPMFMVIYVAAEEPSQLRAKVSEVESQLTHTGLRFIKGDDDLTPLDAFLRGLPMCWDPAFDAKSLRRSRLVFLSQVAALMPVYGRHRGTGHPGMWFWNRGGEPLWTDPLNSKDRSKAAHMLTFGPTGAGKSATNNALLMNTMAIHRPYLDIADAGESFALLVEYLAAHGLSTHVIKLNQQADVSLPPYLDAYKLLEDPDVMGSYRAAEGLADVEAAAPELLVEGKDAQDSDEEARDLLGEMLFASILMITGGEAQEVAKLGRADRYLVTRALLRAAHSCQQAGKPHPLVQDVAVELMQMQHDEKLSLRRRERAEEMGQAMMSFTQGLRGKLFNRYGQPWPDVDVTLMEMGLLTKDGYEDALALAYTGFINRITARGEKNQYSGRPTITLTDEGHLITKNPLLGPMVAKGTKMWRKLAIWFWLATQNLKDLPDSMERVLSMCEFWLLLVMEKGEIDEVARFKTLTEEQRAMVESARKESRKFTEGVLLSSGKPMLLRQVPPAVVLALAGTEKEEKAARRRIMDERGCSELDAALHIARQIEASNLLPVKAASAAPARPPREVAHA